MTRLRLTHKWQATLLKRLGVRVYGPYRFGIWYAHRNPGHSHDGRGYVHKEN